MHNLRTVIGFEFVRTIRRKSFWVSTLAVPLLIGTVFAVSYFSDKTASKSEQQSGASEYSLMVLDESKLIPPAILRADKASIATSKQQGIQAVESGKVQAFFYYPPNPSKGQVEIYARDVGIIKNDQYSKFAQQLVETGVASTIAPEKVALIQDSADTTITVYKNGQPVEDGIDRIIVPALFPILFLLVIILLANQMLSTTTEEKENRVIELMLTTVSSTPLIVGKIVALMAVGLVQIVAVTVPSIIGYLKFHPGAHLSNLVFDPVQILFGAYVFVAGFLIFTGLLIAIGSAVPTAKEANRFLGAGIMLMLGPIYAAAAIVTSPNETIVKFFSFFPTFAPVTLLVRNALGSLSLGDALIGITVVTLSAIVAVLIAIQSFRFGALQYHRKLTIKEILGLTS